MRINHNIAALNTYRQLNSASSAQGKSMEKLSSGLRINRAGDDAAGLAISEKMRGQIRGLDQASKNSQDAISMIQTAEGALNETHDILQRMKELSTQAANGTNTDDDRAEIQKEVNQLTSEINRIGNTTEFNTKKLLQGSTSKSDVGAVASPVTAGTDATNTQATWDTGTLSGVMAASDVNTFEFNGVTVTLTGADNAATTGDDTTIGSVTANSAAIALDTTATQGGHDAAGQAGHIVDALTQISQQSGSALAGFTFELNAGGDGVLITGPDTATAGANNDARIYIGGAGTNLATTNDNSTAAKSSLTQAGVDGALAKEATSTLSFNKVPTEGSTFNVAGKDVAFYDSSKGTYSDATDAQTKLGADSVIDINGKSTSDIAAAVAALDFTNGGNGATAEVSGSTVTFKAETAGAASSNVVSLTTSDAYAGTKSAYSADAGAVNTDLRNTDFEMSVTVGSKTFTVNADSLKVNLTDAATYGSAGQTTVIDAFKNATATDGTKLSDLVDVSFDNGGATQTLSFEAKEVGTDNISVVLTGTDAATVDTALGLTAGTTTGDAGTDAFENGGKDFEETFQVGANQGQSFSISINDMRSNALGLTGDSAGAVNKDVAGAKYTTTKDVTNGTDNTAVEFALDVSSTESASAAIKVLDNAIQSVSAERSKLGASQNRLEHTINNLNTSSENLTAAESRIRDVDMAKEMMNQTKNSILSQAAQAMLAQANQQPQGVLQLLR